MPVFTDALIGDTTHLSMEEFGAYCMILFVTWRNNGNPLPDDANRMSRIVRVSKTKWLTKLRPSILPFFEVDDGYFRQKRLEKEWKLIAVFAEKNRQNGSKGGRPKSLKNNETPKANGYVWRNPNETQTKPSHPHPHLHIELDTVVSNNIAGSAPKGDCRTHPEFKAFYQAYPRKEDPAAAAKAFSKARASASFDELMSAVERYASAMVQTEKHLIKHPATWLNKGSWQSEEYSNGSGINKPAIINYGGQQNSNRTQHPSVIEAGNRVLAKFRERRNGGGLRVRIKSDPL